MIGLSSDQGEDRHEQEDFRSCRFERLAYLHTVGIVFCVFHQRRISPAAFLNDHPFTLIIKYPDLVSGIIRVVFSEKTGFVQPTEVFSTIGCIQQTSLSAVIQRFFWNVFLYNNSAISQKLSCFVQATQNLFVIFVSYANCKVIVHKITAGILCELQK